MDGGPLDHAVLGAGIVGSALAFHLARRSAGRVVLIDPAEVGAGATGTGAGILSYQGWDPWDLALVRESAEELRQLFERSGAGDYRQNGGVRVARTAEGARWLERVADVLEGAGVPCRRLESAEVAPLLPWGDWSDVRAGLETSEDAVFDPRAAAQEYARLARGAGALLALGVGNVTLRREGSRWEVRAGSTSFGAKDVVLCAGAWSKPIAARVGVALPIAPFRAQAVTLRPEPLAGVGPTLHDLDLELYARPAPSGRLLVGDGTERTEIDPTGADLGGTASFRERVTAAVGSVGVSWRSVRAERGRAGLCVATPDRFPLIGPVAGAAGLFVATGFNGYGAMRGPAIARRLADALRSGDWTPLAPASPSRFPGAVAPFLPRPEFPLESEAEGAAPPPRAPGSAPPALADPFPTEELEFEEVRAASALQGAELSVLSDWFAPLLPRFVADALAVGGRAELARAGGRVRGVYLYSPAEEVGSVFTRCRAVGEHYLDRLGRGGLYSERAWRPGGESIAVLAADLRDWQFRATLRQPVRLAERDDLERVRELMVEAGGEVDGRWYASLPRPDELCFLCEVDGRIAGVSWASVAGRYARGHSFAVRPRYRGLGIGTDLLHGRMLWLQALGVEQVVSEIYEGNTASATAAERAGMAVVGQMVHYR